ncbi:hypothetical protein LA303_06450 [Candidatus Sulfidibacterium hydrothermale]|uniref:hypothetical protein n=1 Tax=Candidatus Sulfidibacterium hydrothermale TaxID=2875962 RepID=UPI001F0A1626|nr:hypothetical protein [Candidatus Sulfidibacterium hydrothermale]UBM61066.1 hypothetical protein LA303_06450 [Candidatus Sulfidibacterium hydrothermale]
MSKKIRHIVAVSLLLVFLTPTTVKLLDEAFHHHFSFHTKVKTDSVFHTYHHTCPIPGFTLSFYTVQKQFRQKEKRSYCKRFYLHFISSFFSSGLNYSTLLRAPPFQTKQLISVVF